MPIDRRSLRNTLWQQHGRSRGQRSGTAASYDDAIPEVLAATLWTITPLLSPRAAHSLSLASSAVRSLLAPAFERAKLAGKYVRELRYLPFDFNFPLHNVGPQVLADTLKVLRPILPLRKRDLVGQDAGWAPTDDETWCFCSEEEVTAVIAAGHLAKQGTSQASRARPLQLSATLRLDGAQCLEGPLWTASVGVEWAYGPTADPLQLGLRLGLHSGGRAVLDLDIGSGGWSPWAEHWTLEEHTLTACIAIVAALPDGGMSIIRTDIAETPEPDPGEEAGWACEVQGCEELRQALVSAGEEGVRAVISIGSIRWLKEAPEWCPRELQDLVLNQGD